MEFMALMILPLVGGYSFARKYKPTAYSISRESDQSIYFISALYGVYSFVLSIFVFYVAVYSTYKYSSILEKKFVCENELACSYDLVLTLFSKSPHPSTQLIFFISFALLIIGSRVLNFVKGDYIKYTGKILINFHYRWKVFYHFIKRKPITDDDLEKFNRVEDVIINRTKRKILESLKKKIPTNDFECMIVDAIRKKMPLSITLNSGKVYVGVPVKTPNPEVERRAFLFLPLASGYREGEHKIELTTYYLDYYRDVLPNNSKLDIDYFFIVIKWEEIVSLNLFNFEAYEKINYPQDSGSNDSNIEE